MENKNETTTKGGNQSNEINELKEKIKARSTKLQEKFVKFNKKIGDCETSNKTNKVKKSATTPNCNIKSTQGERPRTYSQTSSASGNGNSNQSSCSTKIHKSNSNGSIKSQQVDRKSVHDEKVLLKINKIRTKLRKLTNSLSNDHKSCEDHENGKSNGDDRDGESSLKSVNNSSNTLSRSRSISERSSANNNNAGGSGQNQSTALNESLSKRSISLTISNSGENDIVLEKVQNKVDIEDKKDYVENKPRTRRRRGRGNSKSKQTEHTPIYAREVDSLQLNAESLLILDLLAIPPQDHTDFLIKLAKIRKILIKNEGDTEYQLNPRILRWRSILMLGEQSRFFTINDVKNLERFANGSLGLEVRKRVSTGSQRFNEERRTKIFEDYVNALIYDELPEKRKKDFFFPAQSKRYRTTNYFCRPEFEESLENFAQKCVAANLGIIVEGDIRINAKNNDQSFIKNVDGEKDAFLCCQLVRKYALHGDIVRVFVTKSPESNKPNAIKAIESEIGPQKNTDNEILDTSVEDTSLINEKNTKAFVIKIVKKVNNRQCVGTFLSYRKDCEFITFVPRDMKMPNIKIFKSKWPDTFQKGELDNVGDVLYLAEITEWRNDMCIGQILHPVGKCGELESENKAILLQNGLNMDPYDEKFNEMFQGPLVIDENMLKDREDIRSECVFTIDPLTARDLDDAMSCKELTNGNFEIGVHISDVAYFLEEESELDNIVKQRTTSVYMVNEVFHMLPKPLCFKCSLLPAEDKLGFSVFWIMDKNGEILTTRFSRTLLNSCTQFAYEHAQKIIDFPDREFKEHDFPQIHNGFNFEDVVKKIKILNSIANKLRDKRFENGALKINKPKIYFDLHPENGNPINFSTCILQTANFLIEEFMLLANQSVADFIYRKFPKISILRNHQPPLKNLMQKVKESLDKFGMHLDISSSKALYESFNKIITQGTNQEALELCISQIVSKPMARARYFCSDENLSKEELWHFALSIPIYTHFTSPIRRYPDVLVHRVLSAALGYTPPPQRSQDDLSKITAVCNEKKYTSKIAGEDSCNLYFIHYIQSKTSILMRAAILEIFSNSMEIILIDSGHKIRVQYPGNKNDAKIVVNEKATPRSVFLSFNSKPDLPSLEIKTFDEIEVEVFVEKYKLKAKIPDGVKKQENQPQKISDQNATEIESKVKENNDESNLVLLLEDLNLEKVDNQQDIKTSTDDEINLNIDIIPTLTFENGPTLTITDDKSTLDLDLDNKNLTTIENKQTDLDKKNLKTIEHKQTDDGNILNSSVKPDEPPANEDKI